MTKFNHAFRRMSILGCIFSYTKFFIPLLLFLWIYRLKSSLPLDLLGWFIHFYQPLHERLCIAEVFDWDLVDSFPTTVKMKRSVNMCSIM